MNLLEEKSECGILYVVATPIGNLKDITLRALEVLEAVDWIAAEDTRHSKKLLQHFGINKPLIALHDHNELARRDQLLEKLVEGQKGALISDAGTPLISDPGYHLVNLLRAQSVCVEPIPGPSAVITALSAAGLPTNRFTFEGFLPAKAGKKTDVLQKLVEEERTMVFYESPHRLMDTLSLMKEVFGEKRHAVVAKELTKQFETFVSDSLAEIESFFKLNQDKVRGEFVVLVSGVEFTDDVEVSDWDGLIELLLEQSLPVKQISEIVAEFYGVKKKRVYQRVLDLKL